MNIRETEKGIYTAVSDPAVRSRDQSSGTLNLTSLCRIPILTYGGLNTDILAPDLAKEGYRVEKEELFDNGLKYMLFSHNKKMGSAKGAVLLAEMLYKKEKI